VYIPRVFVISTLSAALDEATAALGRDAQERAIQNNPATADEVVPYDVVGLGSVERAREEIRRRPPDAVVLLLSCTPERCLEICNALQEDLAPRDTPLAVIFPSSDPAIWERIYESGANMFLPWHGEVIQGLPTYIGSLLGRWKHLQGSLVVDGRIVLDEKRCCVDIRDWHAEFTPVQFRILRHLVEHKGRLVSKAELASVLKMRMPPRRLDVAAALYQHISQIRKKLGPHAGIVRCIRTRGYVLDMSFLAA